MTGSINYPPKISTVLESSGKAKEDRKFTIFDIFANKTRIRVLALLAEEEPLNYYQIIKRLKANGGIVKKFLEVLVLHGILDVDRVFDSEFGQEYYFNREHPKAIAIMATFKLWEAVDP